MTCFIPQPGHYVSNFPEHSVISPPGEMSILVCMILIVMSYYLTPGYIW